MNTDVKKLLQAAKRLYDLKTPEEKAEAEAMKRTYSANAPVYAMLRDRLHAGEVRFDWNGHLLRRVTTPTVPDEYTWEYRRDFGYEEQITDAIRRARFDGDFSGVARALGRSGTPEPLPLGGLYGLPQCGECGLRLTDWTFDGTTITCTVPCPHPTGHPAVEVTIDVPTGRLVFADVFPGVEPPGHADVYGVPETVYEMEHYAKRQVGYLFCGNTCPAILRSEAGMIVGRGEFPGFRDVGGVVTDVWAVCVADAAHLSGKDVKQADAVVRVTPGTYIVRQEIHRRKDRDREPCVYATIRRQGVAADDVGGPEGSLGRT